MPAQAESVPRLRHAALRFFRARCAPDEEIEQGVAIAVSEACTNVVRHAYPYESGEVYVEADLRSDDVLLIVIEDCGVGALEPSSDPGSGFGLHLMATLGDLRFRSDSRGTRVELRFHCQQAPASTA
jgi:anti-sigma regulatory factor (Ser/Thr protein kinase)